MTYPTWMFFLLVVVGLFYHKNVGVAAQAPTFSLNIQTPGWYQRQGFQTTSVNVGNVSVPQWVPIVVGGFNIYVPGAFNDVWIAPSQGSTAGWTQQTAFASFPARGYGGLINVPVGFGSAGLQILVLVGGYNATFKLVNDIWSSIDLGKTWQISTVAVAFSPRESFGLVIGTPYDFSSSTNTLPFSTEYAFLLGGLANNGPQNDIYYTAGMGTQPWLRYPGANAPWSARYQFGCTAYAGGTRIVIAGGLNSAGTALSDVWVWNFITWTQIAQTASFPASFALNLVVTQNPMISQQTFYILGGTTAFFSPNAYRPASTTSFLSTIYRSQNLSNWVAVGASPSSPLRGYSGSVINPTNNFAYYFGGNNNPPSFTNLNDVWSGQL